MNVFDVLNVIGRMILVCFVVFKLTQFRDLANTLERFGLGLMGAGSFLTIPVIMYKNHNPFEGWSITLLTYGAIGLLAGRTWRDYKHHRANRIMVKQGELWKAQRGKP
jgi:hypothetical protein